MKNSSIQKIANQNMKVRSQHSNFWMGNDAINDIRNLTAASPEYYHKLREIQSAISNFVYIITGKNIPVVFSVEGDLSATDGTKIVISADPNPDKLDVQVGLAMHEASHCLLSTSSLRFISDATWFYDQCTNAINKCPDLYARVGTLRASYDDIQGLVHMMMNYMEDRRIDLWMYQSAPGYRPYYEALYDHYWHSEKIDEALQNPKYRVPTLSNYELFILNMTNPLWDASALPGLQEIKDIVNFTSDGLSSRGDDDPKWIGIDKRSYSSMDDYPLLFADAVKIVEIVMKHITTIDRGNDASRASDMVAVMGDVNKQKDFLTHKSTTDAKMQSSSSTIDELNRMSESNATLFRTPFNDGDGITACPVIVYKNVTVPVARVADFPMSTTHPERNESAKTALINGIRMGQILANRLRIVQDDTSLKFTRQKSGKMDSRQLHGLGFGNEHVFHHDVVDPKLPVDVWIDIDLSGSMAGIKFEMAMTVATAIAYASDKSKLLNCVIAGRNSSNYSNYASVAILYNSRKQTFNQFRSLLPYISPKGGTPESLCFSAVRDLIVGMSKNSRKFFINLSDGQPSHSYASDTGSAYYGGQKAADHTKQLMNEFRAAGIGIMSYFISQSPSTEDIAMFKSMYGPAAEFIDPSQVTNIVKTINKLMSGE